MRTYRVVFIDDEEKVTDILIKSVVSLLTIEDGFNIKYEILSSKKQIDEINEIAADIVFFDSDMAASDLNLGNSMEAIYGIQLIRKFREKNARTKVIFYSSGFSLSGTLCYDFTNSEMLQLINDFHIYKMIPRKAEHIYSAIKEAINELDAVLISMEDLKEEYESLGEFVVDDKRIGVSALLDEMKKGTRIGESFRHSVVKMVLNYMMKFGGDED